MRSVVVVLFLALIGSFVQHGGTAGALALKIAPLEYKTTLEKDERKKGFIDISNPSGSSIDVSVEVQAFKQINDDGGLQFYDEGLLQKGIKPELKDFELGPREAIRLFFTVNGKVLPEGDVYAAIFFATSPSGPNSGVGQSVRVGTLISIINENPGSRKAEVTGLEIPFLNLTDGSVQGSYSIRNTGPKDTGFYPIVSVSAWPSTERKDKTASLVFGGHERSNDFTYDTGYGIHRISVSYAKSAKSAWVVVTPPWVMVLAGIVVLIIITEIILFARRRKHA
jgi:hypothetical protein